MGSVVEGSLRRRLEFLEEESRKRATFLDGEVNMLATAVDNLGDTVQDVLKRLLPYDPEFVAEKMGMPRQAAPPPQPSPVPADPQPTVANDDGIRPPEEAQEGDPDE